MISGYGRKFRDGLSGGEDRQGSALEILEGDSLVYAEMPEDGGPKVVGGERTLH